MFFVLTSLDHVISIVSFLVPWTFFLDVWQHSSLLFCYLLSFISPFLIVFFLSLMCPWSSWDYQNVIFIYITHYLYTNIYITLRNLYKNVNIVIMCKNIISTHFHAGEVYSCRQTHVKVIAVNLHGFEIHGIQLNGW